MNKVVRESAASSRKVATAPDRRGSLPAQTVVGHVHLKVGTMTQAKDSYVDTLGFDVTAEMIGALFVSAGGHHQSGRGPADGAIHR